MNKNPNSLGLLTVRACNHDLTSAIDHEDFRNVGVKQSFI